MAVVTIENKIFVGDVGTGFRGTFKDQNDAIVDISGATTKSMKFENPNGITVTKPGSFVTDGTDGLLEYKTVDGDLDMGGPWRVQGYVDIGAWKGHSDLVNFKIYDYLT